MNCALTLSLEVQQERDELLMLDPHDRCRFCHCTEDQPCAIAITEDPAAGIVRLARKEDETTVLMPCSWFLPKVCNSPTCIEKLLAECRDRIVLFDASGKRAG